MFDCGLSVPVPHDLFLLAMIAPAFSVASRNGLSAKWL
jgi:hypothetical protein